MRKFTSLCSIFLFIGSIAPAYSDTSEAQNHEVTSQLNKDVKPESAKSLLIKMSETIHHNNFNASFAVVKGNNMEPYRWLHGISGNNELEHLSLLNGAGLEIFRMNDQVTYFEPQSEPYTIIAKHISGPIPDVFFQDVTLLESAYNFTLGGKGRIAGRAAQLVKIEAKDTSKYNYWLWLDLESSLLLKAAYVNQQGAALEQLQLTHVSMTKNIAPELIKLSQAKFPPVNLNNEKSTLDKLKGTQGNWHIGWLPDGFTLLKSDRHKLNINNELADYYLYGDGLIEISVFVQRPLPGNRRGGGLSSGATSIFVHNAKGFDVSVVGNIPGDTAKIIAQSVQRK
ncbi:MucB/RseB C-terminal domain-containing protein [Pseudoalteromonas denitrificans]|uniref:Sigma E regulatory protein, MucB/RseB n=1 Tax=Pseudoalteromonas denitrificans DSM 6059 TaxID=1123010 RepID=A0A1I1HBZ3_9GAMM|nr:MucB/RseB C-terminal domain-containing protein [Pseudoalteromonas denitrificans]SFC21679.1 sigma E regulatory protein, MucB/RseB [Pseudoalteromonas denitrificans DSM 6059]